MRVYEKLGRQEATADVFTVINAKIKVIKAELKEYRSDHEFCDPRNNGDLTPYQCSAKIEVLNDLKKALRRAFL